MILSETTHRLILSLFDVAYRTRTCLPLLISAGCLFQGVQFRLQINVVNFGAQFPEDQAGRLNPPGGPHPEDGDFEDDEEVEEIAIELVIAAE